jgi:hypothetical protein
MATPDDAMNRAERGFVRRGPEASGTKGRRCPASPRCYVNPLTHNGAHKSHKSQNPDSTGARIVDGLFSIDQGSDGVRD